MKLLSAPVGINNHMILSLQIVIFISVILIGKSLDGLFHICANLRDVWLEPGWRSGNTLSSHL